MYLYLHVPVPYVYPAGTCLNLQHGPEPVAGLATATLLSDLLAKAGEPVDFIYSKMKGAPACISSQKSIGLLCCMVTMLKHGLMGMSQEGSGSSAMCHVL